MSVQSSHTNLHFILKEQDKSDRNFDKQQILLVQSIQIFLIISLAEHYASVKARVISTGTGEISTRQNQSVRIRFAKCCTILTILTTAIVIEKIQRILNIYFSIYLLNIFCIEKYISLRVLSELQSDLYFQCKRLGLPLLVLKSSEQKTRQV